MLPRLFEIPGLGIPINSYGVLIMIGFIFATFIGMKRCKDRGLNGEFALDLAIISMIVGLVGAKIIYVIQQSLDPQHADNLAVFDFGDGGTHPAGTLLGVVPLGIYYVVTLSKKATLRSTTLVWLGALTIILGFLGARILYLAIHGNEYNWRVFRDWQSGFVLYGGFIVGIGMGVVYCLWKKEPLLKFGDIAAPSIMLGLAFGRIGCFMNGCCFGSITNLPWGVRFPDGSPPFDSRAKLIAPGSRECPPLHPTQLYEAIFAFIMFFALSKILKKSKVQGTTFLFMCIFYSIWRFGIEFLRADPERASLNIPGLSFSQTISLFVFIAGIAIFVIYRLRSRAQQEQAQNA